MDIEILSKNEREMSFVLTGTNPQFVNALRRIMVAGVPILAIDTVDFYENDSSMYDEVLAHRLALVPLWFDPKSFSEKGSTSEIVFALNKKGPCTVYSGDLKSADPKAAKPLYDKIPIVKLSEGQNLKLDATAVLGKGKDHAKFKAAKAYYRYWPLVKADGVKNPEEVEKVCPKKALKIKDGKAHVDVSCDLCGECMKIAKPEGSLKVYGDDSKIIFTIESISGLSAKQIFLSAIKILEKKAAEFSKALDKL